MPDASGRFKGIAVPPLPWHEAEKVIKAWQDAYEKRVKTDAPAKR